jgi:hypothetical protein
MLSAAIRTASTLSPADVFNPARSLPAECGSVARSSARITGPIRRRCHQPSPRSRLPDGAGTTEDVRQLRRATHSDLIAERAELDGANAFRDRLLHSEILRAASKPHKPEANALPYSLHQSLR